MGYTVELEESDLRCCSREAAERAAEIIRAHQWIHPYHLQVSPVCRSNPPDDGSWFLEIDHFQGDHWRDEAARNVWLAIAPCMADGATLEFQGEGLERWRIRWAWQDCERCYGEGEVAPGTDGAPYAPCRRCSGRGKTPQVFEEYVQEVVWAINEEITPPAEEKAS